MGNIMGIFHGILDEIYTLHATIYDISGVPGNGSLNET